ncbi:MAG: leucine-rich repeat protein [Bacilli bacterium]
MKKIILSVFLINLMLLVSGCQEKQWEVSFDSNGGEPFSTIVVTNGESINLPIPTKTGFTFLGWFDDANNSYSGDVIPTNHLSLTAKWEILTFVVSFQYDDETLIKEEIVSYGGAATAPTPKNIAGFQFSAWSDSFNNVTENLTIVALYEPLSYEITFLDFDDTILKQETVLYGQDGSAPTEPTKAGYRFIGWDQVFTNVTRTLTIRALYEEENYGIDYVLDGEVYYVHGYNGDNPEVVIPSTYNDLPIVGIYEKAFFNNYLITKVTISENIVIIGPEAFSGCIELTTVFLPDSLNIIGEEAFNACSRLAEITIGAATIGEAAFSGCTGLKSITLLNTVVSIGGWGFWGNSGLKTLYIPESVSSIGLHAFSWCTNLLTINTPTTNVSRLQTLLNEAKNIYVKYTVVGLD